MDMIEITQRSAKGSWVVYGLSKNIFDIAKLNRSEAKSQLEVIAWSDLMTRSQWCWRFMERQLYPLAQKIIYMLGGTTLPKLKPLRISSPVSFKKEPCNHCKALEKTFTPNDKILRKETFPFWKQHTRLFEALVWGSYAVRGSGNYFYQELNNIRGTLTEQKYTNPLKLYDIGMKGSEDFLSYGRNCFSKTEVGRTIEKEPWRLKSRVSPLELKIQDKYCSLKEDSIKAIGGLYVLNEELLCRKCKKNLETKPVRWG